VNILMGLLPLSCGNPIPFIPFPLTRGRGEIERGAAPLLNALLGGGNKGAITTSPFYKGGLRGI